jgi:hypothetical protein
MTGPDGRKPLGEPAPQVSNLALAIVILVVILIQTVFVRPLIWSPRGTDGIERMARLLD